MTFKPESPTMSTMCYQSAHIYVVGRSERLFMRANRHTDSRKTVDEG